MFTYPFFYYPNERADPLQSIRMPAFVHLLCIDLLIVDTAPCIEDISNHKRYIPLAMTEEFYYLDTTTETGEMAYLLA